MTDDIELDKIADRVNAAMGRTYPYAVVREITVAVITMQATEIKHLREALRQVTQFKPQLNKDRDFGQETNFATAIIIAEVALAKPLEGT